MQRIAVFSDTHGRLYTLPDAIKKAGQLDAFVHLGDYGKDAKEMANLLSIPYFAVRGNCDYDSRLPKEYIATFEDASIMLVHGDRYRSEYELALFAEENHCQAILFGHTHTPLLAAQGATLIVNPGSLSLPRYCSGPSFAVLTVTGKDISVQMITL